MDKKTIALAFIVGIFLLNMVFAVSAARTEDKDQEMVAKPTGELGIAAVTEGASYIMNGGVGPLLILAIAFIVGMIVSHLVWGGF
ncbi:MAG: hypothetical protein ABIG20_01835 [archaeon]